MYQRKEDIFNKIKKHLYEEYDVYFTKPESNWYKDLGLSNFELSDFYKWIEQEFEIKMPCFYFVNFKILCNVIFIEIEKKEAKAAIKEKRQQLKNNIVNHINRVKSLFVKQK